MPMKLAIMQPYFFPYLGYWQLIAACDVFVLLDDVQFIRGGWIERNRILNPTKGWQYIAVPLQGHSHKEPIRDIRARDAASWKTRLVAQRSHYRRLAPYYREASRAIDATIGPINDTAICAIDTAILRGICRELGVDRKFLVASECSFDYSEVKAPGDWSLRISQQLGADAYLNPASGAGLFDAAEFGRAGISLRFLESEPFVYERGGEFIPQLSIIDVLMFNGLAATRELLQRYRLVEAQ
jgi:hypothetical protein